MAAAGNRLCLADEETIVRPSGETIALLLLALAYRGANADDRGVEFFESRIRPLLVENCSQCHGEKKQESGLSLNSAAAIQKGGDRGTPFIAGDPDESLLIRAVKYHDDDLKMPPRGKLKDGQIADLVAWIKAGASLPIDQPITHNNKPSNDFNLKERAQHWAYQPLKKYTPPIAGTKPRPGIPQGSALMPKGGAGGEWSVEPSDAFILQRLHAAGLEPTSAASRRSLVRRLTYDLTGLPATPAVIADFLSDESPDAYHRLVDRLLASPRYGERFARHWLDVVRYSETLGFEFDYDLHNAWHYRDYVIRALNSDLPYDQFVIEHLAGDLVPQPRRNVLDGTNESVLATGFWWMHEGKQTPVDIRQDQADRIDNQLDVLGKAFLGQTIACARCHDHKFDAISTRDYYSLAGYLRSSRYQQAFIDPPEHFAEKIAELTARRTSIQQPISQASAQLWVQQLQGVHKYLAATAAAKEAAKDEAKLKEIARERGLEPVKLEKWMKAIADDSVSKLDHPLHAVAMVAKAGEQDLATANSSVTNAASTLIHFDNDLANCFITGHAFDNRPIGLGQIVIGSDSQRPVARLTAGGADSGAFSLRLQGELRSPSFTIDKKFVHVLVAGRGGRVNLVIDGYTLIMNPMYGKLTVAPASDRLAWRTIPVDRWIGHRAFLEAVDSSIPMHGLNPPPSSARVPETADGYIVLKQAVFSDDPEPPAMPSLIGIALADHSGGHDLPSLAIAYEQAMLEAIDRWRKSSWQSDRQRDDDIGLINWLLENGLLDSAATADSTAGERGLIVAAIEQYRTLEAQILKPNRAPAIADGTGEDEFVFLRGNWRTPGERASRGVLEVIRLTAIANENGQNLSLGSGRLELARQLVDASNPLLPRVIVNRLWQNHFDEGLVRTPDDFGRMGQPPSHPELLDWLAAELIRDGWSLKTMTRRMVTSATYQQCSTASSLNPESRTVSPLQVDPENRLLWHMPARRLEAEAIRDSILFVSGRLNEQMHGPSVLPHITAHMEGRGKPQSGPLDGEGRRSLYLNARRNFLTPMLLAFDYPVTFTPIGRRGTSAIPAQALTLMNDPFVLAEARRWAERILEESGTSTEQRIGNLFESAFARQPTADELADAIDFLQSQSLKHSSGSDDVRVWTDLCHVLINVKEFIFVE
jgi:hypothetical protein